MQTSAEAEAKQADICSKHLQKQLAKQQKGLHGVQKEAAKLQKDLANEEAAVQACQSRYLSDCTASLMAPADAMYLHIPCSMLCGVTMCNMLGSRSHHAKFTGGAVMGHFASQKEKFHAPPIRTVHRCGLNVECGMWK